MKDYNNYYPSLKNKLVNDGTILFHKQLESSPEAKDSFVDGVAVKALVFDHTNPLNEYKDDEKYICDLNVNIHPGSVVIIDGENYLVVTKIKNNTITKYCKVSPCNNTLTYLNSVGFPITIPCIIPTAISETNDGITINKYITVLSDVISVIVPDNDDTKKITENMRFIFNSDKVYKVTNHDVLSQPNLRKLVMSADVINDSIDNKELNIADYYNNIFAFSLQESNVTAVIGTPVQLNAVLTKNGATMTSTLIWLTSDNTIATVSNGLVTSLKEGTATITATVKDNPNLTATATITISATVQDNITYAIIGDSEIKLNQTATYTAQKLNNGVIQDTQFDFTLTGDTSYCTFTIVNNTQCTIKCNDYTYAIKLRATDRADNTKYVEKTITLRSLL